MTLPDPSPQNIRAALLRTGLVAAGDDLRIDPRDGRTAVHLGGDRMAWFPHDEEARHLLARERRVLRLIERYCRFKAPRVFHEDADGWDVRAKVPGLTAPFDYYDWVVDDPAFARRLGDALGRILADQHTSVPASELAGWLPSAPDWPRAQDIPNLPAVVSDAALLRRIDRALARHVEIRRDLSDPVLIHGDLGLHNMAFDAATDALNGLFDYEGAAYGDRHQDFKYLPLIVGNHPDVLLDGAIAAYEPLTGVQIDRDRVRLLNATAAIAFLGFRFGHAPEEEWCGRTLAQDLAWTTGALDAAGF